MADHDEVELGAAYLEHCASLLESRAVDPESRRNLDDIYYVADLLNELKSDRRKLTITIRLCQQTRERSPLYLDTHSVALANVGRFQDAIATPTRRLRSSLHETHPRSMASADASPFMPPASPTVNVDGKWKIDKPFEISWFVQFLALRRATIFLRLIP